MSGTSRTHGARRSTNFLMPGTDMAEQYIITQLSFLQAWYQLCRLWMSSWYIHEQVRSLPLSPTVFSAIGIQQAPECRDAEQIDSGCG